MTLRPGFVPLINDRGIVSDSLVEWWEACGPHVHRRGRPFSRGLGGLVPSLLAEDAGEFNYDERRGGATPEPDEQNPARKAFFERVTAKLKNGTTLVLGDAPNGIGNLWAEMRDSFAFDHRMFVVGICNMPTGHIGFGRAGWAGTGGPDHPAHGAPSHRDREHHERNEPARSRRCQGSGPQRADAQVARPRCDGVAEPGVADHRPRDRTRLPGRRRIRAERRHYSARRVRARQDRSNLQYALEVLKADGITADVAKIKWNWHRIAAASRPRRHLPSGWGKLRSSGGAEERLPVQVRAADVGLPAAARPPEGVSDGPQDERRMQGRLGERGRKHR